MGRQQDDPPAEEIVDAGSSPSTLDREMRGTRAGVARLAPRIFEGGFDRGFERRTFRDECPCRIDLAENDIQIVNEWTTGRGQGPAQVLEPLARRASDCCNVAVAMARRSTS
jgi:hypothetical protein